jgi:translation initiation factor 2B subunit (eIF-2B alpha/beta/delta family)
LCAGCPPQRGNHFAETSIKARQAISELGARFIRTGCSVLVHGHSRVVLALLSRAVAQVGAVAGLLGCSSWCLAEL